MLATTVILASTADAGYRATKHKRAAFYDEVRVVDVEPIKRVVHVSVPVRECWDEEVRYSGAHVDAADAARNVLVGGVIGGIIGHQIGSGRGKKAATLLGTVIGASVAGRHTKKALHRTKPDYVAYEQRCRTVNEQRTEERIDGYWVTYRYQGRSLTTRMPYDPGDYIRVRVVVTAVRN